ncbi:hypothetical protein NDN08_000902 [Rhodosorus marinus]|uniref:tRNA pseudouridine synthase n=1 Tax=Rhodosorus marinus TaxID=101924 RepID=A0AAV8UPF1_9RHOD|nr:hypothetical protein NDN08_000902 [Rhodosorus marinus]
MACGFLVSVSASPHQKRRNVRVRESSDSQRVALTLEYDGTDFHGWERKPDVPTIQETVENALELVLDGPYSIRASSRTDAGTHAVGQVCHFNLPAGVNADRNWRSILNNRLHDAVKVTNSALVPSKFHARHSAVSRKYRYSILTDPRPSAFLGRFAWHYYQSPLDVKLMNEAAKLLIDEDINIGAFRKAGCTSDSHLVSVSQATTVRRRDELIEIEITANRFVYGMMRLLVAALVDVGKGAMSVQRFREILTSNEREAIKTSAPARGLCLLHVEYPEKLTPYPQRKAKSILLGLSDVVY